MSDTAFSSTSRFSIIPVTGALLESVLPLIADYQRFYGVTPDENRNRAFFRQFLVSHEEGVIFAAMEPGVEGRRPVGFATLYFPLSSLSARRNCLLHDLYTLPDRRGQGVGSCLLSYCREYARKKGFAKFEWQTAPSNKTAQRVYDKTEATRSEWYLYSMSLG